MTMDQVNEVEKYLVETVVHPDDALNEAINAGDNAGLPPISVAPGEGKFLHLLALMTGAKRILEIGTLAGYSAIWMARAMKDGKVITLEKDAKIAEIARTNLKRAGVLDQVEIRVGLALDSLKQIESEKQAPFDLFFIDADKGNNPSYVESCLKLSRIGSVIIVDNVVREGGVVQENSDDRDIIGTRAALKKMGSDPRLSTTVIQTLSSKGYDGMAIGVVVSK